MLATPGLNAKIPLLATLPRQGSRSRAIADLDRPLIDRRAAGVRISNTVGDKERARPVLDQGCWAGKTADCSRKRIIPPRCIERDAGR